MSSRAKKHMRRFEQSADFGERLDVEDAGLRLKVETVSLKNVPLEERRKEAQKPLYLVRYE
jgi:hypothetical protein